jgi:hypothetical protein
MNKNDFLKILKNISEVLDRNDIVYEIPFCHIDKTDFNYIDIIIIDNNIKNAISELNVEKIEKINNKYVFSIDDLKINMILTKDVDLQYKFNYYKFNFFSYLIRILSNNFKLDYNENGLFYDDIFISKNIKKILEFFDIEFKKIYSFTIPNKKELFSHIINSSYFSPSIFNNDKFKEIDSNYALNKDYYDEFLNIIKIGRQFTFTIENDDILYMINSVFPESEIYSKILIKELKK